MSNGNKNDADTGHKPIWTVMIYMAGDNNLTEECIYALTEMKTVDLGKDVQVFVQYDSNDGYLPVRRYHITHEPGGELKHYDEIGKDTRQFQWESPRMKPYRQFTGDKKERPGEGSSGDPAALYNFIAYCLDRRPRSDHNFLIICGHGAGIQRDYLLRDDSPEGYLTLKELGRVLRNVKEDFADQHKPFVFDMFGMDTCLMSMAEIAYELRSTVKVAIGCPSYAPASGWPYREVLKKIKASCKTACEDTIDTDLSKDGFRRLAKDIVDAYVDFYTNYSAGGLSVTQSALDVRLINQLIDGYTKNGETKMGLKALAAVFTERLEKILKANQTNLLKDAEHAEPSHNKFVSAMILAHWDAQSYNGELYVDLADFLRCFADRYEDDKIACDCGDLADFIKDRFVIASEYSGRKFQWTYGLSIYFPWDHVFPYYPESIDFPNHTGWVKFLDAYVKATRRRPRVDGLRDENSETRMGPDKMGPDKSQIINPIHSMRNPPIVVPPRPPKVDGQNGPAPQPGRRRPAVKRKKK